MIPLKAKELENRRRFEKVIVKKEDGYYVLSEKTKRNLGGPYKTKEKPRKDYAK